jgi:hypothetical protein
MAAKKSDAKIDAGPPIGGVASGSGPNPIGVPKGFTANRPQNRSADVLGVKVRMPGQELVAIEPRYFEGNEWDPATIPPEDRAQIQLALREAGLFSKGQKFTLGVWDESTRGAYKRLLAYANGTGQAWNDALAEYGRTGGAGSGGMGQIDADTGGPAGSGGTRAPLVKRSTNPSDLAASFEVIYRDRTGRAPSPGELSRMVNSYLQGESAQQDALYAAGDTGGNVSDVIDPKLFAKQQAESADQAGAFRQDAINTFRTLGNVLTGGGALGGE